MRRPLSLAALLVLGAASPTLGQAGPSCSTAPAMSIDSLRSLAARLHPNAASPDVRRARVAVGLVFDSSCRLVNHAIVRRGHAASSHPLLRLVPSALLPLTADSARVRPSYVFGTGGVAVLFVPARAELQPGGAAAADASEPWLIWGVLRAGDR